jgi:hypothetical protein
MKKPDHRDDPAFCTIDWVQLYAVGDRPGLPVTPLITG